MVWRYLRDIRLVAPHRATLEEVDIARCICCSPVSKLHRSCGMRFQRILFQTSLKKFYRIRYKNPDRETTESQGNASLLEELRHTEFTKMEEQFDTYTTDANGNLRRTEPSVRAKLDHSKYLTQPGVFALDEAIVPQEIDAAW